MSIKRMVELEKVQILWQLFIAFTVAKGLGFAFKIFKQPEVIGELLAGMILGPFLLHVFNPEGFISIFAELGVIMLLFLAGLETKLDDLKDVGTQAVLVGILGIIFPFVSGIAVGFLWGFHLVEYLFLGTILTATSVGITIRVLSDLGYIKRKSAKIILGAAILDDILALIILSVVKNMALGQVNWIEIGLLIFEATFFVVFLILVAPHILRRGVKRIRIGLNPSYQFALALILCFGLSLLAEYIGLAAIVGAFMAGLVISETAPYSNLADQFEPIGWLLIPFFFVVMGSYIDPLSFTMINVLALTVVLTIVAIVSKALGSFIGAIKSTRQTATEVAIGMIPRGEVGIVIAGFGLSYGVIERDVYSAAIGMVILTTIITPVLINMFYKD